MRNHRVAFFMLNICTIIFAVFSTFPAMAMHRWSNNADHLEADLQMGHFTFKEQEYLRSDVPQLIDARALFKEGWLLPEFTYCEVTTHQAVQTQDKILLLEATYYLKSKTPMGCYLISDPTRGGALVRFEHTVFQPEGDKMKMRRFVGDAWEKPIELSPEDLRNPGLFSENDKAKAMIKDAIPPYESYEESLFEQRRHSF